jgi:hypothetical protein
MISVDIWQTLIEQLEVGVLDGRSVRITSQMADMLLAALQIVADNAEDVRVTALACPFRVEAIDANGLAEWLVGLASSLEAARTLFQFASEHHPLKMFRLSYDEHILEKTA